MRVLTRLRRPNTLNKHKLLVKLYNSCKNVNFSDFVTLVEAFGFKRIRGEGSHSIYKNETVTEIINLQNERGQAKPYQIKQFLSLVEKYNLRLENSE